MNKPNGHFRRNILLITSDQYRFPRFSYGLDAGFAQPLNEILGLAGVTEAERAAIRAGLIAEGPPVPPLPGVDLADLIRGRTNVIAGTLGKGPIPKLVPGPVRQPNHIRCVRTPQYKLSRYFDPDGRVPDEWDLSTVGEKN